MARHESGGNVKPLYVVAAVAVLASTNLNRAEADDPPATSGPSCEIPEPLNASDPSADLIAARVARYMKLCMDSKGALIYGADPRLVHDITFPGKVIGRGVADFLPAITRSPTYHGEVLLSYVVEIDGRTSLVAVLKSSGNPAVDDGALKFVQNLSYASLAYLDFMPVRLYIAMHVRY